MKQIGCKKVADKGKMLYCKELNIYCTATTDTKHTYIEVDESEVNKDGE